MDQTKFEREIREILERITAIETILKVQDFKGIQEKVESSLNLSKKNEEKIDKLEDNQKWLVRLVLGAVVLGILAFIYHI